MSIEYVINLYTLINQCLYYLNNIIKSYLRHVIRIIFYTRLNNDWGLIEVL